jgi:hypothetical protein
MPEHYNVRYRYAIFCDGSTVQKENYVGIGLILVRLVQIYQEKDSLISTSHYLIDDVLCIEKVEYIHHQHQFHLYEAHESLAITCAIKMAHAWKFKKNEHCYIFNDCVTTIWRFNLLHHCKLFATHTPGIEDMPLFFKKNGFLMAQFYPEIQTMMQSYLDFQQIGRTYQPISMADKISKIDFHNSDSEKESISSFLRGQSFIFNPSYLTVEQQNTIEKQLRKYQKSKK